MSWQSWNVSARCVQVLHGRAGQSRIVKVRLGAARRGSAVEDGRDLACNVLYWTGIGRAWQSWFGSVRSVRARKASVRQSRIVLALQVKAWRCSAVEEWIGQSRQRVDGIGSAWQSRMGSALSWMVPAMFGWALQGLAVAALKGWFRHVLAVRCEERPGRAVLEWQSVSMIAPARQETTMPLVA